jgi:hypothetical protein
LSLTIGTPNRFVNTPQFGTITEQEFLAIEQ